MPPEGGYCIGLERITMNILGLDNLRKSSLFPRDMERIDNRLSLTGKKYSLSSQVCLHDKLVNFLKEKSIEFKEVAHEPTKNSIESAAVRGTTLEQGAKALLMFADNNPILVVLSAAQKLDNGTFKKEFNFKNLRMATPEEVKKLSGVEIGAVPPFGNLFNTPVFVDQYFLKQTEIAFNAGSHTSSIILKSADFVKLVNPKTGSYAQG
jgi:prolyl-tRNA editing enzyme YbaK/EbsC (Cys-tRNA(Pro) deacylase)